MDNKQRIKTPEGVSKLLEELWLRHKAGLKQPKNNVFWIDFPPLTAEEEAAIEANRKVSLGARKDFGEVHTRHHVDETEDKPEDLYGAWI